MISYKKINLLNLKVENQTVFHENKNFTIKTPILYLEKEKDTINLIINKYSPQHITIDNIFQYISRFYDINNYINYIIKLDINNVNFYNREGFVINFSDIETNTKCICELKLENNTILLISLRLI